MKEQKQNPSHDPFFANHGGRGVCDRCGRFDPNGLVRIGEVDLCHDCKAQVQ